MIKRLITQCNKFYKLIHFQKWHKELSEQKVNAQKIVYKFQ